MGGRVVECSVFSFAVYLKMQKQNIG